ncbi:MAG: hypothetical protein ACTH44_03775 [Brevibacterium aurantiacum]|uniref:ATP dependent DNA ligase n=1 Tax=Brevibacterium aurantiacum TaxID=273384 RepID=UPI000C76ED65|nr:hypothetical protein [Brevibacterium aurantiacum]AZL06694.1 hypothetical protein CXR24_14735 [Brevibacterium aurantiacum]
MSCGRRLHPLNNTHCTRSEAFASLLVAAHGKDGLVYLGRVGTGFDEHQLRSLRKELERLHR